MKEKVKKEKEENVKARFVKVSPGGSISRKLALRRGFAQFVYATGISPGGNAEFHSGYEATCKLPQGLDPTRIVIRFGVYHGFREGFLAYTGEESTKFKLFEAPMEKSIKFKFADAKKKR